MKNLNYTISLLYLEKENQQSELENNFGPSHSFDAPIKFGSRTGISSQNRVIPYLPYVIKFISSIRA